MTATAVFQCLDPDCEREWRVREHWTPVADWYWAPLVSKGCPGCGGSYFEWLSYGCDPSDVYLTSEWLSGARRWIGRLVVKRGAS